MYKFKLDDVEYAYRYWGSQSVILYEQTPNGMFGQAIWEEYRHGEPHIESNRKIDEKKFIEWLNANKEPHCLKVKWTMTTTIQTTTTIVFNLHPELFSFIETFDLSMYQETNFENVKWVIDIIKTYRDNPESREEMELDFDDVDLVYGLFDIFYAEWREKYDNLEVSLTTQEYMYNFVESEYSS